MSIASDGIVPDEAGLPELPDALARWYSAQASIRRLWAMQKRDVLTVFVTLEPTCDGDDTLPVWLAKSRDWTNDLSALTRREVHLRLIVSGALEGHVESDTTFVAELDWREAWLSS